MSFGLSPKDWDLLCQHVLNPLKNMNATVWIFGSRARGDHKKFSDIDVLYKIDSKKLPLGFVSELKENIENSNITIKVDLVNEDDLAESYRESVSKDRQLIKI